MDSASEKCLSLICPALAAKIRTQAEMLKLEGITFRVTQGLRSCNEQAKLYAQGRTTAGKVVTNAQAGHSWHNFGMSVDIAPDDPTLAGFQADWDLKHPVWKRMVAVGESLGLVSGSEWRTFPDWPHFQLTGSFPVSPNDEVRQIFADGGMEALWKEAGL